MDNNNLQIKEVQIKEHYEAISDMMKGLHDSEREMFERTALWEDIKDSYMGHIIDAQEAYSGTCLIAYMSNKPVGFIFGYAEAQDDSRIEEYIGEELYISDGYIYPEFRRLGIYREMNSRLENIYISRGVRRIARFTLATNVRMQHFLEAEGYTIVRLLYEKWVGEDGAPLPLHLTAPRQKND